MTQHRYKILGLTAALAVVAAGCSKDEFLDVNTNPNNFETSAPGVVLTNTEVVTGFTMGNEIQRTGEILVQHLAGLGNQSAQADDYRLQASGFADGAWDRMYQGSIYNCNGLITIAARVNSPAYAGIAKLQKAYSFAVLTDLWGDVPYSQASLGLENLAPRFDKQQDIYKGTADIQSLFDLVKEGLADLDKASATAPTANDDLVYSGNLTRWKKMGNTLLLKLANTINRKEPALAASIIKEVVAKGPGAYISDNADDYQIPFGSSTGNQNPIYYFNYINRTTDQIVSQRIIDSMNVRNDPRLPYFFTNTPPRGTAANTTGTNTSVAVVPGIPVVPAGGTQTVYTFTGYQNNSGAGVPAALSNRSRPGVYQVGNSGEAPIVLLTNFQRAFIMAEAALTDPTIGNAQTLYQEGIRQSMLKAGVSAATVTAYFAANPSVVSLSTAAADREKSINKIITQKWIAWVGNGYEPYNDYRRTGYPRLQVVTPNASPDDVNSIPARFPYPSSELSANTSQAPAFVKTNVKVWWAER
jgi:hypothetical protein